MFGNGATGVLVPISGTDPRLGASSHRAFIPEPLPDESPQLTTRSHLVVADARAALAALDSTARRLPNPTLLRRPTLQREAQSTSALEGHRQMLDLVRVQDELEEEIRSSRLRADTAHLVVDFAVGHPSFTVRRLERELGLSYGRANAVVGQLVDLGILAAVEGQTYNRRFSAPKVLDVLLGRRR